MAATARSAIITGPAKIVRATFACHTKSPIQVTITKDTVPIQVDAYGKIDERAVDAMVKVSFTPDGRWSSNIRSLLFPYLNPTIGSDIFTASDVPLTIHDSNSHLHTVIASACTKMPSIRLSPKETILGDCEFTGIRGTGADWAAADKLYTVATTGGTLTDTAFTVAAIKTQLYTGAWGAKTGFTAIVTEDGWTIDWDLGISYMQIDEVGTVKAVLNSVSCMAKCVPIGPSWANIVAGQLIQDSGSARGASLQGGGADLTITGADASTIIVVKNAALKTAGYRFGTGVLRDNEVGWVSTRSFSTGVADAIATLA